MLQQPLLQRLASCHFIAVHLSFIQVQETGIQSILHAAPELWQPVSGALEPRSTNAVTQSRESDCRAK